MKSPGQCLVGAFYYSHFKIDDTAGAVWSEVQMAFTVCLFIGFKHFNRLFPVYAVAAIHFEHTFIGTAGKAHARAEVQLICVFINEICRKEQSMLLVR